MKFTVCVPTVRPSTLASAVESIIAQTWPEWELLIIGQGDDASLAEAGERQCQRDSRIRYIHLDERGLSRARNAGLRAATGDIIATTDDDCEAAPDWLETLARLFTRYPQVGAIGGGLVAPHLSRRKLETCLSFFPAEAIYDPASSDSPPTGFGIVGANFAFRTSAAERIGAFDIYLGAGAPDFPAAEDVDYRLRLSAAGVVVMSSPAPVIYHTYGARRGIRQNLANLRAYARGNAGLDAKLTLSGDPHGAHSASLILRQGLTDAIRARKPHRLPIALIYGLIYLAAYRQCLREYVIGSDGALSPVDRATTPGAVPTRTAVRWRQPLSPRGSASRL